MQTQSPSLVWLVLWVARGIDRGISLTGVKYASIKFLNYQYNGHTPISNRTPHKFTIRDLNTQSIHFSFEY